MVTPVQLQRARYPRVAEFVVYDANQYPKEDSFIGRYCFMHAMLEMLMSRRNMVLVWLNPHDGFRCEKGDH
jgi:hypothetical protein